MMGKRKRDTADGRRSLTDENKQNIPESGLKKQPYPSTRVIQIITGSYERILHGFTASIARGDKERTNEYSDNVEFSDTFLFNAHSSAIRCLALSPQSSSPDSAQSQKIILASGGTDERINLYHISASPPSFKSVKGALTPTLTELNVTENPRNRELGVLLHHSSTISALHFPTRSKLLSAAEDNTIAISRTRDWTVLSTIKAPIPKAFGRPSGDTAPLGSTPAGVNDFAVHPSLKLMISVGKGEKCMRLWNLVTGKKAGVLSFERDLLRRIGEGKWGNDEGRKVQWNSEGNEFVVVFERGAVVFGMDSKPKCCILPSPLTKLHQIRYIAQGTSDNQTPDVLALSTEDGRILFYSTTWINTSKVDEPTASSLIPTCEPFGQMGGKSLGLTGRIKDFEILKLPATDTVASQMICITGSSDGSVRLWALPENNLKSSSIQRDNLAKPCADNSPKLNGTLKEADDPDLKSLAQIGQLLGTHETGNRITCLKAFVMQDSPPPGQPADYGASSDFDGFEQDGDGVSDI